MKILFIAPLPPPVTGHSLASQVLLDALVPSHQVAVVDIGKGSQHDGQVRVGRIVEIVKRIRQIWSEQRDSAVVYLTISESVGGNLKDLLIYAACAPRLDRLVIHLHGGTIGHALFDRRPVLRWLNAIALRRVKAVIVTGASHAQIFASMLDRRRIVAIPNYAADEVFVDEPTIHAKFQTPRPLRVLYMSGMTAMKGYRVLVDAYLQLPTAVQQQLRIDFAGAFDDPDAQAEFVQKIAHIPGLTYHGLVAGAEKASLFSQAHAFCLPTSHLEGQPLSILEAYASGCVVLTTGKPGILDIFTPGVNGWEIEAGSVASTGDALAALVGHAALLEPIALRNWESATTSFRVGRFTAAVAAVLVEPELPVAVIGPG